MRHKCLAAFIVFLLFFSLSFLIGFAQVKLILNSRAVLKILDEAHLYDNLAQIGQEIAKSTAQSEDKNTLSQIMIRAASQSFDPVWLRGQAQKNLPLIFDYVEGKTAAVAISIPLADFKKALLPNLEAATKDEIKNLPPCPSGEMPPQDKFPECLPQGTTAEQVNALIGPSDFTESINEIPESWTINTASLAGLRALFLTIKIGFWVSLIFSIVLIGILILLGNAYWPAILRWTGLGLVLPAGIIFLLDLSWGALQRWLANQAQTQMAGQTFQIFNPIFATIDKNLNTPGLIISGIIFGVGAILVILSYALPHPPEPKPVASAPVAPTPPQPAR